MNLLFSCPKCGTDMTFDSESGTFFCMECGHKEQISHYRADFEPVRGFEHTDIYNDGEARQYHCKVCKATLVTDDHSAISECPYCGGQMTLGDRISGEFCPTRVIPFAISKKKAQKAFRFWKLKTKFSPKDFFHDARDKKVFALYLPCWLFDLRGQGKVLLHGVKPVTSEDSKKEPEIHHYDLFRGLDLSFSHIPVNASRELPDEIFEALGAYDFSKLEEYHVKKHMAGRAAEKNLLPQEDSLQKAKQIVSGYMDAYALDSIKEYQSPELTEKEYDIKQTLVDYAYLPIWVMYFDQHNTEYIFAMNGQTGQIAFDPPKSKIKIAASLGIAFAFLFVCMRLFTFLLGGPLI